MGYMWKVGTAYTTKNETGGSWSEQPVEWKVLLISSATEEILAHLGNPPRQADLFLFF